MFQELSSFLNTIYYFWSTIKGSGLLKEFYKIIQIVRALWLAIKPFYMSVCKHDFRSSFISYFIKEM